VTDLRLISLTHSAAKLISRLPYVCLWQDLVSPKIVKPKKATFLWFRILDQNDSSFIIFCLVLASQAIFACACLAGLLIKLVEKPRQSPAKEGLREKGKAFHLLG